MLHYFWDYCLCLLFRILIMCIRHSQGTLFIPTIETHFFVYVQFAFYGYVLFNGLLCKCSVLLVSTCITIDIIDTNKF